MKEIPYKWKIFVLVAAAVFMSTLDSSIVNVALPYIMKDLHSRVNIIQWVVLIYLLTVSSLLLTFGRISDIKGRKIVYINGFIIFSAGSLFCGLAHTPAVLIIARAVQGCGASMLMACSPAIVVDIFPQNERGKALGIIGTVVAAGLTAGPVAGGILLDFFSWRSIFYINIPIGIAATLSGIYFLKGSTANTGTHEPFDRLGSLLFAISLCAFIVFLTHLQAWGLSSIISLSLLASSLISFFFFIKTESGADYPLFDPALLRIKLFTFPVVSAIILFASLFTITFLMPFYLTYPCGFSASATGFIMVTPFMFLFFISPFSGALYDRIGSRGLCTTGMTLLALSLFSLLFIAPSKDFLSILWRLALAGSGTAVFISPNSTIAMNATPLSKRGIASGSVATARNVGMVIGVAVAGLIFSTTYAGLSGGSNLENYTPEMEAVFMASFTRAIAGGLFICVPGILISYMRGPETKRPNQKGRHHAQ